MDIRETAPKEERETIISYDALTGEWHFYSNKPKHIRKWSKFIQHVDRQAQNKHGYITVLEGDIKDAIVSLRKKPHLTSEQKKAKAINLIKARKEKDN